MGPLRRLFVRIALRPIQMDLLAALIAISDYLRLALHKIEDDDYKGGVVMIQSAIEIANMIVIDYNAMSRSLVDRYAYDAAKGRLMANSKKLMETVQLVDELQRRGAILETIRLSHEQSRRVLHLQGLREDDVGP